MKTVLHIHQNNHHPHASVRCDTLRYRIKTLLRTRHLWRDAAGNRRLLREMVSELRSLGYQP